jgi:methyl-accepting chemotaxis protein
MNTKVGSYLRYPIAWLFTLVGILPVMVFGLVVETSFTNTLLAALFAGIFGLVIGYVGYQLNIGELTRALNDVIRVLMLVGKGDLTQRVDEVSVNLPGIERELLHDMRNATNTMLNRLQSLVSDFQGALQRLETDTQAILDATSKQINMANEQDTVVTETTATVNEVRATVTETAERAQSVAETAQLSVNISRTGQEAVIETIDGMDVIRKRVEDIADNILVLSEHTQQIGEIIATVNSLADQSRMLALNASVEAARAGEEGKGFAVVAMEVRNLADQNRDATVQVREILGEIQRATNSAVMVTEEGSKGVDSGQHLVNKAGESIRELSRAIEDAALAAMQIAASTRQQTIGMDQLTGAMRTIKHVTTETVSSTMLVEASVKRLRDVAERVNTVLKDLKY